MKPIWIVVIALTVILLAVGGFWYMNSKKETDGLPVDTSGGGLSSDLPDLDGYECVKLPLGARPWDTEWLKNNWTFDEAIVTYVIKVAYPEVTRDLTLAANIEAYKKTVVPSVLGWFKLANISPTPELVKKFAPQLVKAAKDKMTAFWNIPKEQVGILRCKTDAGTNNNPSFYNANLLYNNLFGR